MSDWASEFGGEAMLHEQRQEEYEGRRAHQNFRNNTWRTKDGRQLVIKDMDDEHLCNAYKQSGRADLFKEMVVRLFEARLKEEKGATA
jgi:hypothetical protein